MGSAWRPENPFAPKTDPVTPTPKNVGVVTSGPLKPIGVNVEDIARATSEGSLASRISANMQVARNPELGAAVQPIAARFQAPGTMHAAASIAMGNLIAPFSDAAANRATEHDLAAYGVGGGDAGAHANLFGAASALGAVVGNTALAGTGRATANVGSRALAEAPVAKTALGRIGQSALSGGLTNAAIGAGGEALMGDEQGQRNIGDIVKTGLVQGAVGAAAGGALGGISEGVGALARKFRPENPFVVHPAIEAAHDVAKDETSSAISANVPDAPPSRPPGLGKLIQTRGQPIGAIDPALLARGGGALVGGVAGATYGASQGDTPGEKAKLALEYGLGGAALGYGAGNLATNPEALAAIRNSYRGAMVTPYAHIEKQYPELTQALNNAGASRQAAQHIAERRTGWVTEGLQPDQKQTFTNVLLRDTNLAKAQAATARNEPQAAHNFTKLASDLDAQIPNGTEQQPWFQQTLDKHKQYVGDPLENAAQRAGVNSVLPVQSAYLRGVSKDRLDNEEIRRAMDARATTDPSKVQPRGAISRAILGERPEVARLERTTGGIPQGPLNPNLPTQPTGAPPRSIGASRTGSAKAAQGTAREYVNDYQTLIQRDAEDKVVRGATNDVYGQLDKAGFQRLGPKDDPPIGMKALQRNVPDPSGSGSTVTERWAVPKEVKQAVDHFEQKKGSTDTSTGWRRFTSTMTRAQISGMPVEATSHMNTLASIVASVPGEKDVAGRAMAAVPGIGAKSAAIREIAGIDFRKPETRALESRLADIGALRIESEHGGIINSSHNALFGPTGVDVRGRLVLARKYLDRAPNATDAELREFITSKLGNYQRANSGTLVNGLQDAGISSFARFQAARIPGSIRSTFGASGLPKSGLKQTLGDIGNTLYRGPVGYAVAGQGANYAMTGHGMQDNEQGHQYDVQLPFTVGDHNRPAYIPSAFSNPVLATGLRATGMRDFIPMPGHANTGGMAASAGRDVANTGLGVLSPAVRAVSIAASGRTPYMLSDGSMLRVNSNRFDKGAQAASNVKSAVSLANPAMSAFASQGGDLGGSSLADALSEDGKRFGGSKATAARVASFLAPRVLTLGTGGRDNAMSADARDQREYNATMMDYKAALRRAPGPKDEDSIIAAAVKDATNDGRFDPNTVEDELRKYLDKDAGDRQDASERAVERFSAKHKR